MPKNTFSLVRKEEGAPKLRPEDKIRSPLAAQLLEQDIIKPQSTGSMQSSASQHVGRVTLRRASEVELAGVMSSRKSKGKKGKCQGIFAPFWQKSGILRINSFEGPFRAAKTTH